MTISRENVKLAEEWFCQRDRYERLLAAVTGYPPAPAAIQIGNATPIEILPDVAEKYLDGEIKHINAMILALGVTP